MHVRLAEAFAGLPEEEGAQMRDLFAPVAERRNVNPDYVQAVIEVLAEFPLLDALLEVRVGRREHPHIYGLRTRLANRHHLALLEKPQQFRLDIEREVADLIEKQRAAHRCPDEPLLIRDGTGEAATSMAEQLAIRQVALRCRAVVGEEHRRASWGADVDRARDEIFSGAAFTRDQHREVVPLQALDLIG